MTEEVRERKNKHQREYYWEHREEIRERQSRYYREHREHLLEIRKEPQKRYREIHKKEIARYAWKRGQKIKEEVLTHYGDGKLACVICEESLIDCLSIDHIKGEGARHRREIREKREVLDFYSWLKQHKYPKGYQTLCMNCQWVKKAERTRNKIGVQIEDY